MGLMKKPTIVCLCGSTRFYHEFQAANFRETMAGKIVLSVGFFAGSPGEMKQEHGEGVGISPAEKALLDELHKRKIDLADEILVLNVGRYIGDSTRSEIAYAIEHGKPVRYLEFPLASEQLTGTDRSMPGKPSLNNPASGKHYNLTTDRSDPRLHAVTPSGQNEAYIILSEEERAKGFVRPVRQSYMHVGLKPKYPLRDLTDVEKRRYDESDFVKYEVYPESESPKVGRFWTEKELRGGCGSVTKMSLPLSETYARDPKFYGSTFCIGCRTHLPVAEFVWDGTDEPVGS